MKPNWILIIIVFGITLQSCCPKPDIIYPNAEITDIYNITDTSANFTVTIFNESIAQKDYAFRIWLDTVSLKANSAPLHSKEIDTEGSVGEYTVIISDLLNNSHYYARIYYEGTFDIGGPNELYHLLIGEEKEFTTLP